MRIAVMGAGSLGSLVGGFLAGTHEVTLVGRSDHMKAVAADGLRITGTDKRVAYPATTTDWGAVPDPELAIVTVKTYDTETAATAMASNPPSVVVTLQNGLGAERKLKAALPADTTILVGTTTMAGIHVEPGQVRCTNAGEMMVGDPAGGETPAAVTVAEAMSQAGIAASATPRMPETRWEKLAVNAAINPTTALTGTKNGAVLEKPLRGIAQAAASEVAAVASSRGIELDERATVTRTMEIAEETRNNESSMARDLRRGRRTEIDAITGAVLARSGEIPVPVNQTLYSLVKTRENTALDRD